MSSKLKRKSTAFRFRRIVTAAAGIVAAGASVMAPINAPVASSGGQNPGVWRWSVKTMADLEASQVNRTPISLTVAEAVKFAKPTVKLSKNTPRGVEPQEVKSYSVDAFIIKYKAEADGDYHVLLSDDGKDTTLLLGVEVVKPEFAVGSPSIGEFTKVRRTFEDMIQGKPAKGGSYHTLTIPIKVHVVGVGFWDETHGQAGMDSGFELHPVIDMKQL